MLRHLAFYALLWLRDFVQLVARTIVGISVIAVFAEILFDRHRLSAGVYLAMPLGISFLLFLLQRLYDHVLFMLKSRDWILDLPY